ncbi:MAG: EAL domain-containing protein [Gemmatimonadetes bacterium]|nr:EAL domain-containing protein [Gemmatimonadota bacterium]
MDKTTVRVLLVDADTNGISRFTRMLHAQSAPGFHVATARTIQAAERHLKHNEADAILLNLFGWEPGGLAALALVQALAPGTPVVVTVPSEEEQIALKALKHGAHEYVLTDQVYDTLLVRSIRHALERQQAEAKRRSEDRAVHLSERRYRALFEQSRDALYITDSSGSIVEGNAALIELFGYGIDELYGRQLEVLFAVPADWNRLQTELHGRGYARDVEVRMRRRDGVELWCLLSAARRIDDEVEVRGYQGIIHDITARKQAEERLRHNSLHDPLTGLPNRALFLDRLGTALSRWRREPQHGCAVLFMDLDRFKLINDSLGHGVGDALLMRVAGALATCVRSHETVARLGGDEFAILLDVAQRNDAQRAAQRIQQQLANAFELQGQTMFTSASIGIAYPDSVELQPGELVRNADIAMYRAKKAGPGRWAVFAPSMHTTAINLLELETDMRSAVARGEFTLHYQPIVALPDQTIMGLEALIRWRHPRRGSLLPHEFISIAEENGMIVNIGWWVLREACTQGRALLESSPPGTCPYIAVNLSSRQVALPDLADGILDILGATGLPGSLLSLEITESSLVSNADTAGRTLARLRDAGVRICIDDFGTGYSSLAYLHSLPIDSLKIDRSFIRLLGSSSDRSELVRTIITLAARLGISTVAEGIETTAQLRHLERLGSGSAQGFLFSRPVDAGALQGMLARIQSPAGWA